jgi:hypothetical protein
VYPKPRDAAHLQKHSAAVAEQEMAVDPHGNHSMLIDQFHTRLHEYRAILQTCIASYYLPRPSNGDPEKNENDCV